MNIFNSKKASARITDNSFILSMPDAETPAVWIMDLSETATNVIRLELDKQGLYVLKKHGGKTAAETIGVYRSRKLALRTLAVITDTLDKARKSDNAKASKLQRNLLIILFIWFVLFRLGDIDTLLMNAALSPWIKTDTQTQASAEDMPDYERYLDNIINNMSPEEHVRVFGVTPEERAAQSNQTPKAKAPDPESVGVPLSADDFLQHRSENSSVDMLF